MVEILFNGVSTTLAREVIYPSCGDLALIRAVERYWATDPVSDPPSGVAIDTDASRLARVRDEFADHVETRRTDFLAAEYRLERVEFVIGRSPSVDWETLDLETRREYAAALPSVSTDGSPIDPGLLYVDRATTVLREDGRGVFLLPRSLKTEESKRGLRTAIAPDIVDVEPAPAGTPEHEFGQMIVTVSSAESERFDEGVTSVRPAPGDIEDDLLSSPLQGATFGTAEGIATPLDRMDHYAAEDDVAFVYFDMFYEDYDAALVYDDPDSPDGLRGYVARSAIRSIEDASAEDNACPLDSEYCIDPELALPAVIDVLGTEDTRFRFIGDPTAPEGIVTRSDLNSFPVYQCLFVLLGRFELTLRQTIRSRVPDWQDRTDVTVPRSQVGFLAPDELAGASLGKLIRIIDRTESRDGLPCDPSDFDASLDDVRVLRNDVAHYHPLVVAMSNDAPNEKTARWLAARLELVTAMVGY